MKKHKPVKMQPLFRKEKDYLKAINNPKTLAALKDMVAQANHVTDNIVHPKNLNDWMVYVISILPKFETDTEFCEKLKELVNEYSNESKGSNTSEPC